MQQNSSPLSCVAQREPPSCFKALAPACEAPGFIASPSATAAAAPAPARAAGGCPTRAMGSPSQHLRLLGRLHPGVVPAPRCTPALGRAPGFAPNSQRRRLGSLLKEGLRSPVPLPLKDRGVCRLWVLPPAAAGCQQDPCCRSGGSAFAVPRISRGLPSASAEHLNYLK